VSTALLAASLQQTATPGLPGADIARVDAARAAARAALAQQSALVDARAETWRYTSLRALEAQALPLASAADDAKLSNCRPHSVRGWCSSTGTTRRDIRSSQICPSA